MFLFEICEIIGALLVSTTFVLHVCLNKSPFALLCMDHNRSNRNGRIRRGFLWKSPAQLLVHAAENAEDVQLVL